MNLSLVRNPDIAKHYGSKKTNQIIVGFAAESENLVEYAKAKVLEKNFDFIVANDITMEGQDSNPIPIS